MIVHPFSWSHPITTTQPLDSAAVLCWDCLLLPRHRCPSVGPEDERHCGAPRAPLCHRLTHVPFVLHGLLPHWGRYHDSSWLLRPDHGVREALHLHEAWNGNFFFFFLFFFSISCQHPNILFFFVASSPRTSFSPSLWEPFTTRACICTLATSWPACGTRPAMNALTAPAGGPSTSFSSRCKSCTSSGEFWFVDSLHPTPSAKGFNFPFFFWPIF